MKKNFIIPAFCFLFGCASNQYQKTVPHVDVNRFMKKWYVIAGRFTFMEKGAHNAVEIYHWNEKDKRIDIDFSFNQDTMKGPVKKIPQKAWIENEKTNAHWKVSPFWPLKFDYLVIALAEDYSWTAIGVPDKKYLWIMADRPDLSTEKFQTVIDQIRALGYPVNDLVSVPHQP